MSQICIVTGVVRGDVRRTQVRGTKVVRFGIPTGARDNSQWFNCSIWGEELKSVADAILPGSNVTVSGPLKVDLWQDQAGVTHAASYLRVQPFSS